MKSKISEKISSETSEEDKEKVREYANNIINSTMKHYYLINDEIKKGYEMPKQINFYLGKDQSFTKPYDDAYELWKSSLEPCCISETEWLILNQYLCLTNKEQGYKFRDKWLKQAPIDITDIVEEDLLKCCNQRDVNVECMFPNCEGEKSIIKFKYQANETNDIVEKDNWNNWIKREDLNKWHKVDHENFIKPPSDINLIFYTKALSCYCGVYKSSQGFICYGIGARELTDVEVTHWRLLDHPKEVQEMLDEMDNH
jgi:hypothetical protein